MPAYCPYQEVRLPPCDRAFPYGTGPGGLLPAPAGPTADARITVMRPLPGTKGQKRPAAGHPDRPLPMILTKENDMMYLRLHENGPEFPIGHDLLLGLARALGRRGGYPDLVSALLELHIPSLAIELLDGSALETEHRDRLWASGDLEVRRALVDGMDFIRNLTDKQAEDIIEADDVFMLRRLAHWIELLEGDLSEQRMSPARRDALWLHLRQHPDMRVLQALAANSALPDAIAIPVGERLRLGLTLNSSAFRSLRLDEIPALLTVSTSALINLARHVEDIPNQEVRHAVLEALLSFPDPAVRMELAGYTTEDAAILTRLLADTDPGVRAAARENLEELRRIEEEEDEDEEEREDD